MFKSARYALLAARLFICNLEKAQNHYSDKILNRGEGISRYLRRNKNKIPAAVNICEHSAVWARIFCFEPSDEL